MNKTIYVRDEDVGVWDRARELAGDKLSPIIMEGLKRYVIQKEAENGMFERIEMRYEDESDHFIPKAKGFFGKWIIPPDAPLQMEDGFGNVDRECVAALTPKGRAVFLSWSFDDEGNRRRERFAVFDSLTLAAEDRQHNWAARKAICALGAQVEELDI